MSLILAGDDADEGVFILHLFYHLSLDVKVARRGHLILLRQIEPYLEAKHTGAGHRHLLVHNAAARRHPLTFAAVDRSAVAEAVLVLHLTLDEVGDRLYTSVRVEGKARRIVVRIS